MSRRAPDNSADSGQPVAWIELNSQQEAAIHEAACEIIAAAVENRPQQLDDPTLAGASDRSVLGIYTTLKRRGRLRACCGLIGSRPVPLLGALETAAQRSATEDPRLPPISPTELAYLDITTWLLFGLRPITSKGTARADEVTIGRHGLRIVHDRHAGLLLPGVATEYGYTPREFLHHVCLKAGLHPTAWREPNARLDLFEGRSFGGPFAEQARQRGGWKPTPICTPAGLDRLNQFCRDTIRQVLQQTTPSYYDPSCPDGMLYGVILAVDLHGTAQKVTDTRISLRPALPMQSTLFQRAQAIGYQLREQKKSASQLGATELTILHDPAMHGTAAASDLRGLDPASRAVLVQHEQKSAALFQPDMPPHELVHQAIEKAEIQDLARCAVYSFAAQTTAQPNASPPGPGVRPDDQVRAPAVAGMFYPSDPKGMALELDRMFSACRPPPAPCAAVFVPHAGWKYSGHIAATVLGEIEVPNKVILLGPKHTREGKPWSIAPYRFWALPGTQVEADLAIAEALSNQIPEWELDADAHAGEHSIEVILPLIQRVAPNVNIVGVVLGAASYADCRRFGIGLADVIRTAKGKILLVISSDLNHFATEMENRRLDAIALDAIEQGDPEQVYAQCQAHAISVCGLVPCVVVMEALRHLDWGNCIERVAYATSADVSGDSSRVVGYGGLIFR